MDFCWVDFLLPIAFKNITFIYSFIQACVTEQLGVHVCWLEDYLEEMVLSFYPVAPKNQT